jgi:hypothetical protein
MALLEVDQLADAVVLALATVARVGGGALGVAQVAASRS